MATTAKNAPIAAHGGARRGGGNKFFSRASEFFHHLRLLFLFFRERGASGPEGLTVRLKDGRQGTLVRQPLVGERTWVVKINKEEVEIGSGKIRDIFNTSFAAGYGLK